MLLKGEYAETKLPSLDLTFRSSTSTIPDGHASSDLKRSKSSADLGSLLATYDIMSWRDN